MGGENLDLDFIASLMWIISKINELQHRQNVNQIKLQILVSYTFLRIKTKLKYLSICKAKSTIKLWKKTTKWIYNRKEILSTLLD